MNTILGKKPEEKEDLNKQKEQISAVLRDNNEEISLEKALFISTIAHPLLLLLIWLIITILTLLGFSFSFLADEPKIKDIEFILVNKPEKPPINKNTKFRSDRNSRAGGKHDPKKKISDPEPTAAASKPTPPPQPPKAQTKTQPTPPAPKPIQQAPKAPPRPVPNEIPSVPPIKPPNAFSVPVPKPQLPKDAAPKIGGPVTSGPIGAAKSSSDPAPIMAAGGDSNNIRRSTGYTIGGGMPGNPSPGNPGGSPGVDALKEPDFGPYMMELQRRIKRRWNPPRGNESKRVVLLFKVSKDGRLISLKMHRTSGVPEADQAAIRAVKEAAPFRPLPPEYSGSDIDIQFTFDYNVFGVGGQKF